MDRPEAHYENKLIESYCKTAAVQEVVAAEGLLLVLLCHLYYQA